ncbi:hypothetical protein N7541_001881 [Penicillium brevicompactum]|uniref:Uncharacterized protein n=1 Tax=Penicillium brevicompactum TaxID=5074 RepID=A0A9W9RJ34_PENBR|nr:hypothetical protein N7541_001881 [Penicillium brevicompactum]
MSFDKTRTRDGQPPSPFRYASKDKFDLHVKPSSNDGLHSRHAIRSRSLSQAYRDASRTTMPVANEDLTPVTTPNAYDQIHDGKLVSDYVRDDDWDKPRDARRPASQTRQTSLQYSATNSGISSAMDSFPDAGFGGDLGEYQTRKSRDYTKDEQRLKRATGQHSPVFSKAQVGRDPSRADNWRRRQEAQIEAENHISEDDGNLGPSGPSPNLPSGWGHRAGHRQEWERKVSPPTNLEQQERPYSRLSGTITAAPDSSSRPMHTSRSPARSKLQARSVLEERPGTANINKLGTQQGLGIKEAAPKTDAIPLDGEQIPHSPITIYKNSTFTRPSPSKRDSRDLLRSLSRSENHKADEIQTPEPPKLFERKIYDKTPRVTGAWIDTPMTQRVAEKIELPEDLTKDIVLPRSPREPNDAKPPAQQTNIAPKLDEPKPVQHVAPESPPTMQPAVASRPPLPRPHLPKSALETVIEDASSGKEIDIGDDTIESLQAIMDGPSEIKIKDEDEDSDEAYEKAVLASFEQAASKETNSVDFDSLNLKLNSLMKHINDVKKGLDGLEGHVTRDVAMSSKPRSPAKASISTDVHAGKPCKGCGTCSDGRVYAAIRLPRLFERDPQSRRLKLTRLFWFIVIPLCWWVIECLMSDQFSYSDISEPCDGYCLQPDAPVYPWVTVTMLWRWSHLSIICTPILTIIIAFSRLVTQLLGFSDGYADDLTEINNMIGEIRINGTPVAFPWLSAPMPANIEPQTPQPSSVRQSPHYQQPEQRPEYAWPPPDAYTPHWGSDLPAGDEAMDADEFI